MALAPFRRERAVKEILLVKALPLRVVLLYRTAGWNARLFRKSLCKRLCKSLKTLSSAGGRPFRRSSGAAGGGESGPPGPGDIRHDMAVHCRRPAAGYAVPTARGKRGQGHRMVPLPPLDSPKPSFALTHRRCAAKRGLRGLGSVRRAVLGRCQTLNLLCVICSAVSARPSGAERQRSLRKAPLRSSAVSWSSKRPCGPLAF